MDAEREDEVQADSLPLGAFAHRSELLLGQPLGVAVVSARPLFDRRRSSPQSPVAFGRRPLRPRPPPLAGRPERRVVLGLRTELQPAFEVVPAEGRRGEERPDQGLEDPPLRCPDPSIVDQPRGPKRRDLSLQPGRLQERPGLVREGNLGDRGDVQEQLVPEQAAGRRVRARSRGVVGERGEERKRRHRPAAQPARPLHQPVQVGEVAGAPAPSRTKGVQREEHAPCPGGLTGLTRRRHHPWRRDHQGRGGYTAGLDGQPVIAEGKPGQEERPP